MCFIAGCSHGRSYEYFAESINSNVGFYGYPCSSLGKLEKGKGKNNCTIQGDPILMGDKVPKTARGTYYLRTNAGPGFAMGLLSPY